MGFFDSLFRRSNSAPAAMKRLRELQHEGHQQYRWQTPDGSCDVCAAHVAAGPCSVAAGLTKSAPVPGRETGCACNITLESA